MMTSNSVLPYFCLFSPTRSTLGITQVEVRVGFSLAQACLFRVMREPRQSKAPPPATGAPPATRARQLWWP